MSEILLDETVQSLQQSLPLLKLSYDSLTSQVQTFSQIHKAYKQGYGGIQLHPTPKAYALYEAFNLPIDTPITLNNFLQHLHQYLYHNKLYNSQTQTITLNPLLQTTFSLPASKLQTHYFSLFRQIPQLFTQIPTAPSVVESPPSTASLESAER